MRPCSEPGSTRFLQAPSWVFHASRPWWTMWWPSVQTGCRANSRAHGSTRRSTRRSSALPGTRWSESPWGHQGLPEGGPAEGDTQNGPGLAQQQLENMLQVPESDQSQFRSCYPGAGWGNAISLEFRNLAEKYQTVIVDVCQKMGFGMAEFLDKRVTSEREWDKYCHYVAGLVGIGLSRLFSASELEDPLIGEDTERANSMGLFLQKTNIIRDYLEDQREGREFWPQETWSKYVKKLGDFAKPENIDLAVQCLNELITNTLHHIPDVITYLSRLRNQSIFNFCAIPQVMAIATLAACYNNQQVFKGVVKIRKGQAVTLMMDATNMPAVKAIIHQYMEEIYHRIPNSDPCSTKTQQIISTIRTQNLPNCQLVSRSHYSPIYLSFVMLLAALSWQYLSTLSQVTEDYVQTGEH
uniref:Squalene synthase n=1 Tax=Bos mutus grunniens TaxID=30521 RepID=A0A8C0A439_BOSMU